MSVSKKKTGIAALVPQHWILLTAAGTATVGLACGIAKPASADWWKFSAADRNPAVAKPAPVENGFAGTIRKLTAESRRAAEQGDHAKAVQLAERAAKISEAAAQVVGPQGDCSPKETARFLAQTRARRNGLATPGQPTPPLVSQQGPRTRQPAVAAPQQQIASTQPSTERVRKPASTAAAKPQSAAVASASGNSGPALFGRSAVDGASGSQARRQSATGESDRAISAADQATPASTSISLFGAGTRSLNSTEAGGFRKLPAAQRNVVTAAAPAKQTLSDSNSQQLSTRDDDAIAKPQAVMADTRVNPASMIEPTSTLPATDDSWWTEELPMASEPRPAHQEGFSRFQRSPISRQGEWLEANTLDNRQTSNDTASTESLDSNGDDSPVWQEATDTLPEFPIVDSTTPAMANASSTGSSSAEVITASDEEAATPSSDVPSTGRPQLRLRGEIQQVAGEFPAESSPARYRRRETLAKPEKNQLESSIESKLIPDDAFLTETSSDDFIDATTDEPVADFPIQRVLRLRDRLQAASRFNPGASKVDAPASTDASKPQPKPATWEDDWENSEPTAPVRPQPAAPSSSKRPSLKLRERPSLHIEDSTAPAAKVAKVDAPSAPRSAAVGHSEMTRWKSVDATETKVSLPVESQQAEVSQTGYEAPQAMLELPESAAVEPTPIAPPPPEWYEDGQVRRRAAAQETARNRSSTPDDQAVHTSSFSASKVVALVAACGLLLLGFGLAKARSTLNKQDPT